MKKEKIIQALKIFCLCLVVFVLVGLVFKTSYVLLSDSLVEEIKVDDVTSNYISFNYTDNNEHVFKVDKPKKVNDFFGKRLSSKNYFEFDISVSDEYLEENEVYYDLVVMDLGNLVDEEFIKFYLTDQDNKPLIGYDKVAPVFSTFKSDGEGKVIYTGSFNKNDLKDEFRLRIWVSNKYKKNINNILAYHVKVRIKE